MGNLGFGQIALRVVAVVAAGLIAVVAGFSVAFHRSPFQLVTGQLAPSPQDVFHKDRILVLVEGLDYDYNDKDEEFSTQSRSDVIKAVDLDFRTNNVYVLSIPRDMDAVLPNGNEAKINQAQADGGVREAQSVISSWLGIPSFDRYVVLRVNTTKDIINAIGGIDLNPMNSDALKHQGPNGPIDYDDSWGHLHIHFKPGMQHMNGDQAVSYARFRHDWCSDPCRIMRQTQVMQAALNKLRSDRFNTLLHINDLIGVFSRDVQTNLSRQEQLALASAFARMPKSGLHSEQVPYVDDKVLADGGDVLIPDETKKAQLVDSMLLNPPVPTASPNAQAVAAINPQTLRVDVENGSGIPGAARKVAAVLRKQGFTIGEVGNASGTAVSEVHEHSKVPYAGLKVRQALGKPAATVTVISDTQTAAPAGSGTSDVTVIVGTDLAAALTAQASTLSQ
ncbi:MAG TPA: LCP family protein [Candidatus Baltobacteraceae bacterium]|nr:LCP family protein [Candidatus Baltobacteraceae bacterium]